MNLKRAMDKFSSATRSDAFARYEKGFAERINAALSQAYARNQPEPELVQIVERVVNNLGNFPLMGNALNFRLSTMSAFIHGNKSQVEFRCYGKRTQVELGDLLFVMTVVLGGERSFEKLTINQFKRDGRSRRGVSWAIRNRAQLYLLSRFPRFRGVRGSIVPAREYALPNYSGCLGSYGLLYRPGEFTFVSGTEVDAILAHRNVLRKQELYSMTQYADTCSFPFRCAACSPFCNHQHAYNTFDFAHRFLRVGIGEPVFTMGGPDNSQAKGLLHDLLSEIRIRARRDGRPELLGIVDRFFRYAYPEAGGPDDFPEIRESDSEGGGIGVIHTVLDLGE